MAELNITNRSHQKKSSAKKSTKVDLTPMVDLGFLLITFFVFTTTMTKVTAMDMLYPNDKDSTTNPIAESGSLTVLLGKNDQVYYYEGKIEKAEFKKTNYSAAGIRSLIVHKKKELLMTHPTLTLQLIIKPSVGSSFKNLVNIIDEANICTLKRYYIAELTGKEIAFLQ